MLQLCTIALDVVNTRSNGSSGTQGLQRIIECRKKVIEIDERASSHLRESSVCASMKDYLEHWNWHMHRSYVVSELCRPVLTRRELRDENARSLRVVCIEALADTVDAFLNLHNLTAFARTSWAAVHRSLSSALLLGILKEPMRSERVYSLIQRLIMVMSSMEYSEVSEVPGPVARAVAALERLNINDSDGHTRGESWSTTSTSESSSPHAQMYHILWGTPSSGASVG